MWDAKYRLTHRKQEKKRHKKYRRNHRAELRAKARAYHKANKAKRNSKARAWIKANPQKARRSTVKWRRVHEEMYRSCCAANNANREARLAGVPGKLTGPQLCRLFKEQRGICLRCKKRRRLGPDHVIPLCKKSSSNRIANIQGLCLPCNKEKRNRTIDYRKRTQKRSQIKEP